MSKTAMKELIEFIEQMPAFKCEPVVNGIHAKAKELLMKEKAQIGIAFNEAQRDMNRGGKNNPCKYERGLDYYTQTFTQ